MEPKKKILISGDVKGKFRTLFNRVDTLNKKSGPFDLLLCVGDFFGEDDSEFTPYKNGTKPVSVPTYILGPVTDRQEAFYPDLNGCELGPNISYLGKRGLYTADGGLKIAYLSGLQSGSQIRNSYMFNEDDVMALKAACIRGQPGFRGVDILLTTQWPTHITDLDPQDITQYHGSNLVAWLAVQLKPRYHITGQEGIYYERKPYRNSSKSGDALELASRYIALAPVGNENKHKWLYAASLTPVDKMRMTELCQRTTDETESPFPDALHSNFKVSEGGSQYFYDLTGRDSEDMGKRKGNMHRGREKRPRPEFDQAKCWFCLGSPEVQKHLVISIGSECYLALAKGGLVPFHLLILPITHQQATVGLPEETLEEIEKFKEALRKYFLTNAETPIFFERNFKTSHLQIQVVPVPNVEVDTYKDAFTDEAEANGIKLQELPEDKVLSDVVPKGVPYFMVQLPDGQILYTRVRPNFPLQFGREVLAGSNILDMPERVNWQDCGMSTDEEMAIVQKFRKAFEPYDFTM